MNPKSRKSLCLAALWLAAVSPVLRADLGKTRPPTSPGSAPGIGKTRPAPMTLLGVGIAEVPIEVGAKLPIDPGTGLVVQQVLEDSPAAIAGLKVGDILARLNETVLVTPKQLQTLILHRKPGDQVEVTYYRKGEKKRVAVMLAAH